VRFDSGRTAREELKALRKRARWLASRFEVLVVKFGADALVGLVPVAGDAITFLSGGGCHAGSITILYADRAPEIAPEAQCDRPAWPILAGVVVRIVEVDLALIDGGKHPIT
jgi:hypothetical protein